MRERISNYNKAKSKQYSWDNVIAKLEEIYDSILDENKNEVKFLE